MGNLLQILDWVTKFTRGDSWSTCFEVDGKSFTNLVLGHRMQAWGLMKPPRRSWWKSFKNLGLGPPNAWGEGQTVGISLKLVGSLSISFYAYFFPNLSTGPQNQRKWNKKHSSNRPRAIQTKQTPVIDCEHHIKIVSFGKLWSWRPNFGSTWESMQSSPWKIKCGIWEQSYTWRNRRVWRNTYLPLW